MGHYYLSADLEGVTGVTSLPQCYPVDDKTGYHRAVSQLVLELRWVMTQVLAHDPEATFCINDAHNTMINLPWADLGPAVSFIGGKPKPCAMMAGLDASFDGAFLIGYHAMAGTLGGNLAHTFHTKLHTVQINGVSVGEGGMNALYAQEAFGVPVLLASGDQALCQELDAIVPGIQTVETKVGYSLTSAKCHPWQTVQQTYEKAIAELFKAKSTWGKSPIAFSKPYTLTIRLVDALSADIIAVSPLYTRVDGLTVSFKSDSMETVYRALQSAYMMLAYAKCLDA